MAFDVFDAVHVLFELFFSWRYWLPIALAGAVAFILYKYFPEGSTRTVATVAVVITGFLSGRSWQRRYEDRQELR